MHEHLMLDLETMGSSPDAPVVAIGAVFFEPETGEIGKRFYTPVSLASDMEAGAQPDGDTIIWWLKKSAAARSEICRDDAVHISKALVDFNNFLHEYAGEHLSKLQVWGNGATFDNVIMKQAFKRCGLPVPWQFRNDRDVRTLVALGKLIGYDPIRDMSFAGDLHNALDDAIHQAKYASVIHQRLMAPHTLFSENAEDKLQ